MCRHSQIFLLLTIVLSLLFVQERFVVVQSQASQGPNSGTIFETVQSGCTAQNNPWSNPAGAQASDNSYATVGLGPTGGTASWCLRAKGFGFAISSEATITGIFVEVEKAATATIVVDTRLKLLKAGGEVGVNGANPNGWSNGDVYWQYGSASYLWGTSWSPSDINGSGFGLSIVASTSDQGNVGARIDHIRITVYYAIPPPFDFSFSNSGGITVVQGSSGSNTITATLTSGSTQAVSLSTSGLPSGASYLFSPSSGSPTFTSTLTITTSAGITPVGSYTITVSGTGGGLTRTTQFTLTVTAPFDVSLSNSGSITVTQGASGSNTITVTLLSGSTQAVLFSSSGLPTGTTGSFSPTSCSPTCTTTFTVTTSISTPIGSYTITITGTGGGLIRTTTFTLTVTSTSYSVTITASQSNIQFTVDSVTYTGTFTGSWTQGSSHTVTVPSVSNPSTGTRYSFLQWSDGSTALTRTITMGSSSFTLTAQYKTQYLLTITMTPSTHGNPNLIGDNWFDQNAIQSVSVTDPADVTAETRWKLDGYRLDAGTLTVSTSLSITMNAPHTVEWVWHKEIMLTLAANVGAPSLTGAGWQLAGGTIQISAPTSFFIGNNQYRFRTWIIKTGTATILDAGSATTSITLQTDPTVEAQYDLVTSTTTSTFTTESTITTTSGTQTIVYTTKITGTFAHDLVQVQFQIKDSSLANQGLPTLLYRANVTVRNDANQIIWKGITDPSGYTPALALKKGLIYTIQIQYYDKQSEQKQSFNANQNYLIDLAGSQPPITLSQLETFLVPLIGLIVGGILIMAYLSERQKTRQRTKQSWL